MASCSASAASPRRRAAPKASPAATGPGSLDSTGAPSGACFAGSTSAGCSRARPRASTGSFSIGSSSAALTLERAVELGRGASSLPRHLQGWGRGRNLFAAALRLLGERAPDELQLALVGAGERELPVHLERSRGTARVLPKSVVPGPEAQDVAGE